LVWISHAPSTHRPVSRRWSILISRTQRALPVVEDLDIEVGHLLAWNSWHRQSVVVDLVVYKLKIDEIVLFAFAEGAFDARATAEEIAHQHTSLDLADVYAAISYFLGNDAATHPAPSDAWHPKRLADVALLHHSARSVREQLGPLARARFLQRRFDLIAGGAAWTRRLTHAKGA
jgi:hypothetical protein